MACTLQSLMLPVRGDGKGDNVFAHAAALAKRFGAHVQVIHCRPKPEDLMPYGVVVPRFFRKQLEEVSNQVAAGQEQQLRDEFHELSQKLGLTEDDPKADTPTASFLEYTGKQADAVKHYGRLSDLILVPQPDRSTNLGFNTLKSALFTSARPVMMCPETDQVSDELGRHIAIGWNGSLEATRALAQGMGLIEAASEVTILTTGSEPHATTAEELQTYLGIRGVTASINRFKRDGNIGRNLLQHATSAGADVLLMGAYHESYERETIFGGNTQAVVDEATIPVVLVH
ncbi:universal stress protein [Roseovarius aestuariivivens]|uniref:universal stress protein n=1 Tax=Roseovarius aestuariivivens TaxID=1888910 RepID=UPI00107FDE61|nr:universal stress protein [Roseovarius aestuariivivens]